MKINKKIKCIKCGSIVEENGTCLCGNLILNHGNIFLKEGKIGVDCIDITPILLNE